jgi:hypothetical protein
MRLHLFYSYDSAMLDSNEMRHAQKVVCELATAQEFTILGSEGQSMFDGFEFLIECNSAPALPSYIKIIEDGERSSCIEGVPGWDPAGARLRP